VHGADVRAASAVTMLLSLLGVHVATMYGGTLRRSVLQVMR
jgi:hypothetical protein